MALNYDVIFKQMCELPQVKESVRKKAEELRDYIELRWPDVNDLSDAERARLQKDREHSVLITEAKGADGRPVAVVTVRHAGAVAKQAQTGFMSRAVRDVS